jgi:hypothetical protein|nr:MAG TPA: hypothetical protein [Caudoviricetes sp.]
MPKKPDIIDLHGNLFKKVNYDLVFEVPTGNNQKASLTRDLISDEAFCIFLTNDGDWVGYSYLLHYHCYVRWDLKLIGYDESKDIRKAYLYGNKRKHT